MNKMDSLMQLTRRQIDTQNAASRSISKSNIAGSQIIAKEIESRTHALESTINRWNEKIGDSITYAADQISAAIDMLGERICYDLSEIKWQLAQQNETLEKILEVLYESRNNEARQLVRQGVRHYVNDEFGEAEERFTLALNEDTTDYQVLMNLAYIEIHKSKFEKAFTYFNKALSLPEKLDSLSRARTQWAIARLFYVQKDYAKAYSYAKEAFKNDNQGEPGIIYALGVYAALSGDHSSALNNMLKAIELDPIYFSKSAVEPDLEIIREKVLRLLGEFSSQVETKAIQSVNAVGSQMADIKDEDVHRQLNTARKLLSKPSYTECLRIYENMNILQRVISRFENLQALRKNKGAIEQRFSSSNNKYLSMARDNQATIKNLPSACYVFSFGSLYVVPGILVANTAIHTTAANGPWILNFILWPLISLISIVGLITNNSDYEALLTSAFKGLLIAGVIIVVTNFIDAQLGKNISKKNVVLNTVESELNGIKTEKYEIEHAIEKDLTDINALKAQILW